MNGLLSGFAILTSSLGHLVFWYLKQTANLFGQKSNFFLDLCVFKYVSG